MNRTISVSGTGQTSMQPDQAIIQLGVQADADSAGEALTQNNHLMQALLDTLSDSGVAQEDIQTTAIQLFPRYEESAQPQTGTPRVVGYTASNIVEVRVRDLDNLGTLLDQAVQAGSNVVQSIRFEVSDPSQALMQAREQAVSNARSKAEQLASLVNAGLGEVLSVSEQDQTPGPIPFGRGGQLAEAAVPIEPGSQAVQVTVNITWSLITGEAIPSTGREQTQATISVLADEAMPGSQVRMDASGLPTNTLVEIGLGRVNSEYDVVDTVRTDAHGRLSSYITVPGYANPGERWVVVVITRDNPPVRVISDPFTIQAP